MPSTDILARGDDLVIRVELAGVDPEDVDLSFSHGVLTVAGARRAGDDDSTAEFLIRERYYGTFRRAITLPDGTEADQINAEFDDGLVEITVQGVRPAESTQIALADRSEGAHLPHRHPRGLSRLTGGDQVARARAPRRADCLGRPRPRSKRTRWISPSNRLRTGR